MRWLQRSLSSADFAELLAEESILPRGEDRADLRSAIVAVAVNRTWGGKAEVADFMPRFEEPERLEMTPEQTVAFVRAMNAAMGGTEVCRGDGGHPGGQDRR